jgi:hypothetical protein
MSSHRLKLNTDKTEVVIFASRIKLSHVNSETIEVAGDNISISGDLKYLGVWLDNHLAFDKQISHKCKLAAINIRCIASIRRFIDLDTAKLLATSLVLSHLDYSNCVLFGLPKKSLDKLQRSQNWAAKVVLQKDRLSSSKDALYQLHWLPIIERINFKILCLTFKCLNHQAPSYLSSLLTIRNFHHSTRASTNGAITLEVPLISKASFAARSFSVAAPQLWNALPPTIRSINSFPSFKKAVKTHLFRRAYD